MFGLRSFIANLLWITCVQVLGKVFAVGLNGDKHWLFRTCAKRPEARRLDRRRGALAAPFFGTGKRAGERSREAEALKRPSPFTTMRDLIFRQMVAI